MALVWSGSAGEFASGTEATAPRDAAIIEIIFILNDVDFESGVVPGSFAVVVEMGAVEMGSYLYALWGLKSELVITLTIYCYETIIKFSHNWYNLHRQQLLR